MNEWTFENKCNQKFFFKTKINKQGMHDYLEQQTTLDIHVYILNNLCYVRGMVFQNNKLWLNQNHSRSQFLKVISQRKIIAPEAGI